MSRSTSDRDIRVFLESGMELSKLITVTSDGTDFVLGRPDLGIYVAVPEPGAVFVTTLQSGGSLAEATRRATEVAGEEVDGEDFLAGLTQAGLFDEPNERSIRWIEGVSPRTARRLFGPVGWSFYALAALFAGVTLVVRADLRPTWESAFFLPDPVLSLLTYLPVALAFGAVHEIWHWLAGRAAGIAATFRVSHRGVFVVFETDLSQVVSLPRRKRYGPFLAGMAFDSVILASALGLRILHRSEVVDLPSTLDRFLGVVVLGQTLGIAWQWVTVYLRSDGYAVLANALGCHNLYRITWLTAKQRLLRLTEDQEQELADGNDRDRTVARWFSFVYVAGMLAMVWLLLHVGLPTAIGLLSWVGHNLVSLALNTLAFWESVAVVTYLIVLYGLPPVFAWRERRAR